MTLTICSGTWVNAEPAEKAGTVDRIHGFKEGLARFEEKGKWGYMDLAGNVVIKPQFDMAYDFQDGKAYVIIDGKYFTVDKNGNVPAYKDSTGIYPIDWYHGDLARIIKGDRTAFYNIKSGKLVTDFIYDNIGTNMYKDFSIVSTGKRYGVLDANGNYIIQPQYDNIYVMGEFGHLNSDGNYISWDYDKLNDYYKEHIKGIAKDYYFVARLNGKFGVIDKAGKLIIGTEYDSVDVFPGYIQLKKGNKLVVYNTVENKMLSGSYDQLIGYFNIRRDGLLGVIVDGKDGIIDGQGKFILQPNAKYINFEYLPDGYIKVHMVENNKLKYQIIDNKGKVIVPVISNEFELVYNTDSERNKIKNDYFFKTRSHDYAYYGLLDKNFKEIIPPAKYRGIGRFVNGIAVVEADGSNGFSYGFINKSGKVICKPVLMGALDFSEGMAAVTVAGKSGNAVGGYVNSSGKFITLPGIVNAESFVGDLAQVSYGDTARGVINKSGALVTKDRFDDIRYTKGNNYFIAGSAINDGSVYSWSTYWQLAHFYDLKGKKLIDKGYVRTLEYNYPSKAFIGITYDHKIDFIDSNFKIIKTISYPSDIDIFSYLEFSVDEGYLKYATRENGKIVEVMVDTKGNEIARGRRTYDIYLSPPGSICYDEHVGFIKESKLPRRPPDIPMAMKSTRR